MNEPHLTIDIRDLALTKNPTLESLNLSDKYLQVVGTGFMADALINNETDQLLDLSFNSLRDRNTVIIAHALKTNTSLKDFG